MSMLTPLQHLCIVHKSNVLPVTDRLFYENVRAVATTEVGKYDAVTVTEQVVDSAMYK